MKQARVITIPDNRKISRKYYQEILEHGQRSAMYYLAKSMKSEQEIIEKLLNKGYLDDTVFIVPNPETELFEEISEQEINDYIEETEHEEEKNIIDVIIESLKEGWFIDDEAMAIQIVNSQRMKGRGDRVCQRKMMEKKIPRDIIDKVFNELDDSPHEINQAINKASSSYRMRSSYSQEEDYFKRKSKLYRFLASRGFSTEEISNHMEGIQI